MKKGSYVNNVDELIAQTSLDEVLVHYGHPPSNLASGEYRMNCVFNAECTDSSYGNLAIHVARAKQVFCHVCGTRGNLLTLIHGLEKNTPPAGGKLRGQEFKDALNKLKEIRSGVAEVRSQTSSVLQSTTPPPSKSPSGVGASVPSERQGASRRYKTQQAGPSSTSEQNATPKRNVALARHENEAARKLADLYEDLIVDPADMSPAAAKYVRSREWMTPDLMRKWGVGYIPRDGRSMFRGLLVYTHRNAKGEPISYSARDPLFEEKHAAWLRGRQAEKKKPIKHKYVKGYGRGLELYGQQTSRLEEPAIQESLAKYGLIVVEGANDVIRLDELGLAAVGLCSNRATESQVNKIKQFANQVTNGRVMLMPDNDEEGEAGFRELLWGLIDFELQVQLAWSRNRYEGLFSGMQPEDLRNEDWRRISN